MASEEWTLRSPSVDASGFEIASVQAVIYIPDTEAFSSSRVLANLLSRQDNRYDGPVASLPLPPQVDPTIPRIVLQSADETWQLRAAPARIDSVWTSATRLAAGGELSALVAQCSEILEHYVRTSSVRVGRLALVVTRGHAVPTPAQVLIGRFCTDEAHNTQFRHSENFEIHNHKRYRLSGPDCTINSWMRCRTGLIRDEPGIAVEQDINTLQEEFDRNVFDTDQIRDFFKHAQAEAESILRLYFHAEGQR